MARSDRRHAGDATPDAHDAGGGRGRPWLRWLVVVLLLALLAGAGAAYQLGALDRWLVDEPDPATQPAEVPAPEGLELPALTTPPPVAVRAHGGVLPSRRDVRKALVAGLDDHGLGRDVHALVSDVATGRTLFSDGRGGATPASTLKLLTCTAALQALGPEHRFETSVVRRGHTVTLVGGGDPLLAREPGDPDAWPHVADLSTLARRTAHALRADGVRRLRLGYDATLFTGPADSPAWEKSYVPDGVVSPISALWVDEGRTAGSYTRVADPAATAATEFAADLRKAGLRVATQVRPQRAHGQQVAAVESPPLSEVVEHTLSLSDNEAAEVLARQVGLAAGGAGSFDGGVRGVTRTLEDLGVDLRGATIHDGSGLARSDRLDPRTLVDVLRAAATHDRLRAVLTGLPVAGFTGSLAYRFDQVPAAGVGRVRAKTGTLTGVSALAGIVQTADGRTLAFFLDADEVRLKHTLDARDALDRLAARLAAAA